jgi:adenine/guanine phosphoribosyltransferase-like PRPP-binding protein
VASKLRANDFRTGA